MRLSWFSMLAVGFIGALGACDDGGEGTGSSRTTLTVETLSFVSSSELARVDYTITSESGAARTGTLRWAGVVAATATEDEEPKLVWRSSLDLPENAYVVELIARNQSGEVICTNENGFATTADFPTEVYQLLTCQIPPDDQTGDAIITLQAPDTSDGTQIQRFDATVSCASPGEESRSFFSGDLPLADQSIADFGFGPVSTNVWHVQLNDLPPGYCRVHILQSPQSLDRTCTANVGFTVTEGAETPVNLVLPCTN